jgi:hypothetical protein
LSKVPKENSSLSLEVRYILLNLPYARPRTVTQDDPQFARLDGNSVFNSSYLTKLDELVIHVNTDRTRYSSDNVEFSTVTECFTAEKKNVKPYTNSSFFINYFCPTHFLTATKYVLFQLILFY